MDDRLKKMPLMRLLVLGAIGAGLAWAIVSTTFVSYIAVRRPDAALTFGGGQAQAWLLLGQRKLDAGLGGGPVAPQAQSGRSLDEARDTTAATFGRLSGWAKTADGAVRLRTDDEQSAVVGAAVRDEAAGERAGPKTFELSADEKAVCEEVRALALAALAKDPLNARAYRMLGQVASQEGDDVQAERFMTLAVQRSMRETIAVHWLLRRAIDTMDYTGAADHIDLVLRTYPQLRDAIMPSFAQVAEAPEGSAAIKAVLARNPPWRKPVLSALPAVISDARTPLTLLMHLKSTPHPPTAAEIKDYIAFLLSKKFYELAYDTWLQFLPDEQFGAAGNVFNGRFQFPLSGLAFDWAIAARSGVTVDIVPLKETKGEPDANEGRALSVEFNTGQVDFPGVTQTVMVRPGSYEFKGRFKGTLVGRRGLKWQIVCLEKPAMKIGESSMMLSGSSTWQAFSFPFTVEASACGAQQIKLDLDARSASERLVSGTMMFADIEIVRANAGAGEATPGAAGKN